MLAVRRRGSVVSAAAATNASPGDDGGHDGAVVTSPVAHTDVVKTDLWKPTGNTPLATLREREQRKLLRAGTGEDGSSAATTAEDTAGKEEEWKANQVSECVCESVCVYIYMSMFVCGSGSGYGYGYGYGYGSGSVVVRIESKLIVRALTLSLTDPLHHHKPHVSRRSFSNASVE